MTLSFAVHPPVEDRDQDGLSCAWCAVMWLLMAWPSQDWQPGPDGVHFSPPGVNRQMRSALVSWMPLLMVPVFSLILNFRGCQGKHMI